jgi:hypothetical protein
MRRREMAWVAAVAVLLLGAKAAEKESEAVVQATLQGVAADFLTEDAQALGTVACVEVRLGEEPEAVPSELPEGATEISGIRRAAECQADPDGAYERSTHAPAFIITVGPIQWESGDEAHVHVQYFRSQKYTGSRVYRVVREASGWVSLGQIIQMSPA